MKQTYYQCKVNRRHIVMNILMYDTKKYDKDSFDAIKDQYPDLNIDYVKTDLS